MARSSERLTASETIDVYVDRISYRNDENGYSVLKCIDENGDDPCCVVGTFFTVASGLRLKVSGVWSEHPRFGRQFKAFSSEVIKPKDKQAILLYLSSGLIAGVRDGIAEIIVDAYGEETIDVLDQNIDRIKELEGIGETRFEMIKFGWESHRKEASTMMFLLELGLSTRLANKVFSLLGAEAEKSLRANPYSLVGYDRSIGFSRVDEIAGKLNFPKDAPERVAAAILEILTKASHDGHTALDTKTLVLGIVSLLKMEGSALGKIFYATLDSMSGVVTTTDDDIEYHSLKELARAEEVIAASILNRSAMPCSDTSPTHEEIQEIAPNLSEEQRSAVCEAGVSSTMILTGGPGVGKTTTVNAIIKMFIRRGMTVALAAPTGRAAKRMSEVTGLHASTVHKLLEVDPSTGGFCHNEGNWFPYDVLILDESSMLDVHLAASFLLAVAPSSKIIFVGDVDQLPSVGAGNVLKDMIASGKVSVVALTKIFRQAECSKITQTAHAINKGSLPALSGSGDDDCLFVDADGADDIHEIIDRALIHRSVHRAFAEEIDLVRDVQILTPMNKGPLGTVALNEKLQKSLNPNAGSSLGFILSPEISLFVGDKVIQTANDYTLGVVNGEIGRVTDVYPDQVIVNFDDSRSVTYTRENAFDLRLAYAITIHKSQGSEFPVVIIATSSLHRPMLQRNLFYTGVTRAKRLAIFVGQRGALAKAAANKSADRRTTRLKSILLKGIQSVQVSTEKETVVGSAHQSVEAEDPNDVIF